MSFSAMMLTAVDVLVQPGLPPETAGAGGVRAALPTDVNNEITSADRMQLYATRQVKRAPTGGLFGRSSI